MTYVSKAAMQLPEGLNKLLHVDSGTRMGRCLKNGLTGLEGLRGGNPSYRWRCCLWGKTD